MGKNRAPREQFTFSQDRLHEGISGISGRSETHRKTFFSGASQGTLDRAPREPLMKNAKPPERASLGEIVDELTAAARGDDERMWNFQQALQKHVSLPCDGFVIGEPVKLVSFNDEGNQRRGVTATCRRSDGREYEMAVSEVLVTTHSDGSRYVAAYRHWMGPVPYPLGEKATPYTPHSEERVGSITLRNPVELIVLSVKQTTARCRLLRSNHVITIRSGRIWRSEEHTSELQSLTNLVCRLLLEKKKNKEI